MGLLTPEQFLLTLLVRLAAIAVLATMLARYRRFRHILIFERRGWVDRLVFTLSIGVPIMAGVTSRVILKYDAADLTLEGALLAGLIAGPYTGALVGLLAAIPPLIAGEVIALPFLVGCGFAGGGLREACPKEAIWKFSPFVLMDLPKHIWQMVRKLEPNWQMILLLVPVALQEQEKALLAAKIEALKSQINPHFLFNTLTSISSLIRSQPDTARMLIIKLSALLRRLLRSHQQFVTLREELESIDEYLDIEVVRFGPNLRVKKDIGPDTLDILVPSMILQPLVENSIKHGLARKIGPGSITIRSARHAGRAIIEVEDDGMGFMLDRLDEPMSSGIGLANVRERLAVVYGTAYQLTLDSEPGRGTSARIEVPELIAPEQITA